MKQEFIPVLLGSDDNVYGLSRSFYEKYGIKPIALCKARLNPTKYTKIIEFKLVENLSSNDIFLDTVINLAKELKKKYKKLILIPCSDYYLDLIVENKKEIEKYYENKFITKENLDTFVTKDKFYDLCEKYNLTYPKTIICKYSDRKNIHEKITFDYPIVLKPNNSNSTDYLNAEFKGKKKAYIIKDESELKEVIKNINSSSYKDNLIIQEFIEGDDTHMRVVNAYCNKNGKVKMIALGNVVLEEYYPTTIGNYASIITDNKEKELLKEVKNFLEKIKYTGFANFDFKYDEKDKKYKCFEINPRQGRSSFFVEASGISLAQVITDDLIFNKDYKEIIGCPNKVLWMNIPTDLLNTYVKNKKVLNEVNKLIKENKVVHTLFYDKDMSLLRKSHLKRLYNIQYKLYDEYFIEK